MRRSLVSILCLAISPALFAENTKSFTMAALGDSISVAFNSNEWGLNDTESWAVGFDSGVNSHFERLLALKGDDVEAENFAKSGATSDDLARQTAEAIEINPDYVTLLMGGNDLCHKASLTQGGTVLSTFKENVEKSVDALIAANPAVKILLVPVPDLYQLWKLGKDSTSCRLVWRLSGVCGPLLGSSRTDAERQMFVQNLQTLNASLADIAKARPSNVKMDPALASTTFSMTDVSSLDCFHPSTEGQALISRMSWETGWFN